MKTFNIVLFSVFLLILTIGVLWQKEKIEEYQNELEIFKDVRVTIIMTDTVDYQDDIIYWTANVFLGKEKRRVIIPLNIRDTIFDEFLYGDGYYKTTLKKLIEK